MSAAPGDDLPVVAVLPALRAALRDAGAAVLVAPPGAGKTTLVAPALLAEPWCTGQIVMLSPRRVAARAAAERIADLLGERVGQTAGYVTRLDTRRSPATRLLVVTEAVFVSMLQRDPELAGVSAVLFDEAHERHLEGDLALALAIEARGVLRPDLRLLVMSATIDGARFAALLGEGAPVVESAGRAHPLAIRWLGAAPALRVDEAVARAVLAAWRDETGDVLVFLPGIGEIERVRERLVERLPQVPVLPLHGRCEPAEQAAAVRRDPHGRRRIVLATAIAETSLTLDGVRVVVDAGLARRAEFDHAAGTTRLVTRAASQAAAAQRAGRAARQGTGVAYRLWEEAAHPGRRLFDPPEMLSADLTGLCLALTRWGTRDAASLAWLDPPPAPALAAARARLAALGVIDDAGAITVHGRAVAALPLDPALAHMLLFAADHGVADDGARLALLLQERGVGGRSDDLAVRLHRLAADRSAGAVAARRLAARWADVATATAATVTATATPPSRGDSETPPPAALLAEARPDLVARRRDATGEHWLSASGRGYRLDPVSPLARADWLVIGDAQGEARGARITGALALTQAEVERWLGHRIDRRATLRWLAGERRVEALLERRLGAIVLARGPDPAPDQAGIAALLVDAVQRGGLGVLPLSDASRTLLVRARYAGLDVLGEAALIAQADTWLAPLLAGRRRLDDIAPGALHAALTARLAYPEQQRLARAAPSEFTSPAGTRHPIDYDDPAGPSADVRAQALFGLDAHPHVGDPPAPLLLRLTSPAGRPLQATRDLPGFWRDGWRDVAREMRGRYPRHRWPEAPWAEVPSLRTRNALAARGEG